MKKAVAFILIILPIFLMVSISLAGSLLGVFGTIKVENIYFVDDTGIELEQIDLGLEHEYQVLVLVMPEKASDKTVRFYSDSDVIEISESGLIVTKQQYGSASIKAVSADGRVEKWITVVVSDKTVTGVSLKPSELTMKVNSTQTLGYSVEPSTAVNKKVIWTSSDPEKVYVSDGGVLTARALTELSQPVVITIETEDGGFTAECSVTVTASEIVFVKHGTTTQVNPNEDIVVAQASIDLLEYIMILTDLFDADDIIFRIEVGSNYAELTDGSILTFNQNNSTVRIRAEVKSDANIYSEAHFRYRVG